MFVFLVRRPLLAVFGKTYQFIQAQYSDKAKLWPSVRRELRSAAWLLPLAMADLRREWSPTVCCVDACGSRLVVMRASWSLRSVKEVGRLEERWRFKINEGIAAGLRELTLCELAEGDEPGNWKTYRESS